MAILGAHMSIAGGYHKAVEAAAQVGFDCVQLFTKNNNQWRAKEIAPDDVMRFRQAIERRQIVYPIAHNSYLINMASPDKELWKKSVEAMILEVRRAALLRIKYLVAHPGAYTTSSEKQGIKAIVRALDEVHRQTIGFSVKILLETTAGQGSSLGCRFEHLADVLHGVQHPERLGVCFDTCHVFAAGYPMGTEKEYQKMRKEFNRVVGVKHIMAFHLNDSKKPLGSRVDRHEAIGRGEMGKEPFRFILNDIRFRKFPMVLETPKHDANGREMDKRNLRTLKRLIEY